MIHAAWLFVLLAVFTTARFTRLINEDAIFNRPRAAIQRSKHDALVYFVTCPWCVSVYVGTGVALAVWYWHGYAAVQIVLLAATCSYLTGLMASRLDK